MGNTRVDEPVITISAMVKVGPWMVESVEYGKWRPCRRCETMHKETWVCTIDPSVDDATVAARLQGDRTWRVGSTCGPTLEMVSDHNWAGTTKDLSRIVRLVVRATHTIAKARDAGYRRDSLMEEIAPDLELLKQGKLERRMQKRMGFLLTHIEKWLERKSKAEREGAAAPPVPWVHSSLRTVPDSERK
jgi:hypothetical protein